MKNEIKLWKRIVCGLLAAILMFCSPLEAMAQSTYNRSNMLEGGTPMLLRVDEEFDSRHESEVGSIHALVETDVYSSDGSRVLIQAGTPAHIEYTLERNGTWGKPGRLCLTFATLRTVDNKQIALRMGSCKGGSNTVGAVIALSIVFFPFGLLSGLMKGGMPVIKYGTTFGAYVLQDTEIDEAQQ